MAIDAYVGLPGHGKSYGVVEHVIIPSLKQGRHVVTNIPLDVDALLMDFGGTIEQLPDDWFELDDLSQYGVAGSVLVLDELWRRWPSGMLTNQASIADKSLLAEHRHRVDTKNRSMRIVLVTQDLSQIASWVRVLVESTYRVSKKGKKFYVVSIYSGSVTGAQPPKTALLRQTTGRFKPEIYAYYSSATQSETGGVGDESTADSRASILKSWGLWALIIIFVFVGSLSLRGILGFFGDSDAPEVVEITENKTPHKPVSGAVSAVYENIVGSSSNSNLPLSTLWRVSGYAVSPNQHSKRTAAFLGVKHFNPTEFVVISSNGFHRHIPIGDCDFFDGGFDIFCEVDGEMITSWSGSGAVTSVFQPSSRGR